MKIEDCRSSINLFYPERLEVTLLALHCKEFTCALIEATDPGTIEKFKRRIMSIFLGRERTLIRSSSPSFNDRIHPEI